MSFEKKEWKYGDTIAAEELNRMEEGIEEAIQSGNGAGALIIGINEEMENDSTVYTLDHTWQEIHDALSNGRVAYVANITQNGGYSISYVSNLGVITSGVAGNVYSVGFVGNRTFEAIDSPNQYPTIRISGGAE